MPGTSTLQAAPRLARGAGTLTRRAFLRGGLAFAVGGLLYADEIGRHELDVTERTFYLRNLPPAFHGFRIVQFSDIHLEEFTEDFFLNRVIARVNTLAPDLLLVTGDFISRGPMSISVSLASAARCGQLLGALTCRERYGVFGNHDAMVGPEIIRGHMEANGLPLLVNRWVRIERDNQHLILGGLDDIAWGKPNLAEAMPEVPDAPMILMVHEPDYVTRMMMHPRGKLVDLVFSGHTHGGQVRLPGLPPLALPPMGKLYPEGHYQVGATQLYVNRGIGTVGLPLRFNCPPEITVATLQPAPAAAA